MRRLVGGGSRRRLQQRGIDHMVQQGSPDGGYPASPMGGSTTDEAADQATDDAVLHGAAIALQAATRGLSARSFVVRRALDETSMQKGSTEIARGFARHRAASWPLSVRDPSRAWLPSASRRGCLALTTPRTTQPGAIIHIGRAQGWESLC